MTKKEAIDTLKLMQAQIEWEYPMDYSVAIDIAIAALAEEPERCEYYALCRHGRDENKLRTRLGFCEYCNEDAAQI